MCVFGVILHVLLFHTPKYPNAEINIRVVDTHFAVGWGIISHTIHMLGPFLLGRIEWNIIEGTVLYMA